MALGIEPEEIPMSKKTLFAFTLAAGLAGAAFSQQAAADPIGGAIIGGAIGAAVGGPPGAAVGAILGTAIGSEPYYYRHRYSRGYYDRPYGYAPPPVRYSEPARYYEPAPAYYAPPAPVVYSRSAYAYDEPRYARRYEDRRYDERRYDDRRYEARDWRDAERHYQRDEYRYR
jgi:hypothetical protein